jgi:WD40 repeat protein
MLTFDLFILSVLIIIAYSSQFSLNTTLANPNNPNSMPVRSLVLSPDQSFFVSTVDKVVNIWQTTTLTVVSFQQYLTTVTDANIHPIDSRIFVSTNNGTISILDSTTFNIIATPIYYSSTQRYANKIVFQ